MNLYQHVFDQNPDALLIVNADSKIVDANVCAESMFGYARTELIGANIDLLIPRRFINIHANHVAEYVAHPRLRRMGAAHVDLIAIRKDGQEFAADIMISPLHTDHDLFILCAARDISKQKAVVEELQRRTQELESLHEKLKELASRDALTGLFNRRTFQEHTEWLLRNAARRHESISLLMLDLDFFKRVNDRFGHAEGDRVLSAVANVLRATCRQNDVPARYGGEEFAIALPDTDESGSRVVAEAFRTAIEAIADFKVDVTASIGAVTFAPPPLAPCGPELFESLINQADRALYAAKNGGRNRTCHVNTIEACGGDALLPSDR